MQSWEKTLSQATLWQDHARQVLLKHSDPGNLSHGFREILSIILIPEDYSEVAKENKVPANAVRPLS
jgi:hypothetical protein